MGGILLERGARAPPAVSTRSDLRLGVPRALRVSEALKAQDHCQPEWRDLRIERASPSWHYHFQVAVARLQAVVRVHGRGHAKGPLRVLLRPPLAGSGLGALQCGRWPGPIRGLPVRLQARFSGGKPDSEPRRPARRAGGPMAGQWHDLYLLVA